MLLLNVSAKSQICWYWTDFSPWNYDLTFLFEGCNSLNYHSSVWELFGFHVNYNYTGNRQVDWAKPVSTLVTSQAIYLISKVSSETKQKLLVNKSAITDIYNEPSSSVDVQSSYKHFWFQTWWDYTSYILVLIEHNPTLTVWVQEVCVRPPKSVEGQKFVNSEIWKCDAEISHGVSRPVISGNKSRRTQKQTMQAE